LWRDNLLCVNFPEPALSVALLQLQSAGAKIGDKKMAAGGFEPLTKGL
jgi:hypothetical protein